MITDDPNEPALREHDDSGMQKAYLVLSDAERAKGFVRPVRTSYIHVGVGGSEIDPNDPSRHGLVAPGCGAQTRMGQAIAETYARDPKFYGGTFCVGCGSHFPVGENGQFVWVENGQATDLRVGV